MLAGGIIRGQTSDIVVGGRPVEIVVASLTADTVRLTVLPIVENKPVSVPLNGGLAPPAEAKTAGTARSASGFKPIRAGNLTVRFTESPPTLVVENKSGVDRSSR